MITKVNVTPIITIGSNGQYAVDETTVLPERVRATLVERLAEPGNEAVLVVVRADTGVPFSTVRRTLEDARAAGAQRLAIATRQKTEVKP
jgi:biopolymer transport protein ExbD